MEIFTVAVDIWIAAMLSIQSWILYKLLPEIKSIKLNSSVFNLFKGKGNA